MRRIKTRAIPRLRQSSLAIGPPGALTRSFPTGEDNYFRRRQDETLRLVVKFRDAGEASQVVLATDLGDPRWRELPFSRRGKQRFELCLPLRDFAPGTYHFRVKYTLDGENWLLDCAPISYLLVDPAHLRNLRIYTLIPTVSGHIADWREQLPRIRDMGFNVVHLLPVTHMDESESPYAARDLFALDPSYLTPGDGRSGRVQFDEFAAEAVRLKLGLCIDLVFNHVGIHGKLAKTCPDWFVIDPEEPDGFKRAGWSDGVHWHRWRDLALLDYEHPRPETRQELWQYMVEYARFWAQYAYDTNGVVRLDNLHSSHPDFLHFVLRELRRTHPELILQAEFFADPQTVRGTVLEQELSLLLATPWEHHFVPELRRYVRYIHGLADKIRFLFPISSHDSGSPAEEFGHPNATVPRYVVAALFGTGFTGMAQGVEYGIPEKIDFITRQPRRSFQTDHDFSSFIAAINRLLDRHRVFQRGGNLRFVDDEHDAVMAAYRTDPGKKDGDFLVLANLDIYHQQTIEIDCARHEIDLDGAKLVDVLDGTDIAVPDVLRFALEPCAAMVVQIQR